MKCKHRCHQALVLLTLAAAGIFAGAAESPSALLEKAIYTEETVGKLEEAAKLYQQVVDESKKIEQVAAKAQYRLGLCLLKQGKKDEGVAALEEVVKLYPQQKEIVAAAKKHLPPRPGLRLLPAPWTDGETMHQRLEMGGGLEIGTVIYSVRAAELDGQKIWRFRQRLLAAGRQMASMVEARRDDLRPIRSIWNVGGVSRITTLYQQNKIEVVTEAAGKETKRTIEVDPEPYDNEQGVYVFRCLPMTEGYQTSVPVFSSIGSGQAIEVGFQPQGKETVEVPAGKFDCTRILLPTPINQTFWYSADDQRLFVKLEANNVVGSLVKIEIRKAGETQMSDNADMGVSLALPPDWYAYQTKEAANTLSLLDPDAQWTVVLKTTKLAELPDDQRKSPRAWAEQGLPAAAKVLKGLNVREDSWQQMTIADQAAVSYVADYTAADGRKMARLRVCLFGQTIAAGMNADCPREDLERMKTALTPIIESLRAK